MKQEEGRWIDLASSDLAAIRRGEDADGPWIEVRFRKSGRACRYVGAPRAIYDEIMSASSHGKAFHRVLRKSSYPFRYV